MRYWVLKSEPETFSIEDLEQAKAKTTPWDGVRNYQARNFIRDKLKKDDLAFFYHSSCQIPAIVGIVEVVSEACPDATAFDPKSPYYDPKSAPNTPRWFKVDVKFKQKFNSPISLATLRQHPSLNGMILLQKGNRLSVIPLTHKEWDTILKISKDTL